MIGNHIHRRGVWTNMHRKLAVLAVVALTACGVDAAPEAAPTSLSPIVATTTIATDLSTGASAATADEHPAIGPLPDLAVVSAAGRVAVVRGGAISDSLAGLVGADGQTLISTAPSADQSSTTVRWTALAAGSVAASVTLDGHLSAIASDATATVLALTAVGAIGTEIVITGRHGELFRHTYSTELLPEGFTSFFNGSAELPAGLFVIEYLDPPPAAPGAPRRYRVRVLDTASGDLALPLSLRNKGQTVDEQMLGFGRTHVQSPVNQLLFTLYRGVAVDDVGYAFVHTLGFVNGVWCLGLPAQLDLGTLPGAIVLADHERELLVASANGEMSEFIVNDISSSPHDPTPDRTVAVWSPSDNASGPALAATGNQVLVGQGDHIRWVAADTLTVRTDLVWDMQIEAVALMSNGNAIVAGTRRISEITPQGDLAAEIPLPTNFGSVARIILINPLAGAAVSAAGPAG